MENKRKMLDCRMFPSDSNCSITISGTEEEIMPLAMMHLEQVHKGKDTPEMREEIRKILKDADD